MVAHADNWAGALASFVDPTETEAARVFLFGSWYQRLQRFEVG